MLAIDIGWAGYATKRQGEILQAVLKLGSITAGALNLGITHQTASAALHNLARKAKKNGYVAYKAQNVIQDQKKILAIPDLQTQPNTDMLHIHCIGEYIVAKKPHIIICGGDFADMASLSSYDKGKRSYEGARYANDIEAAKTAMSILLRPMRNYNATALSRKEPIYSPHLIMLLGNHEDRINRATQIDPMLYGTISVEDLGYEEAGWEVHDFLTSVVIDGIAFSHYFPTGLMGKPCGTAQQQLNKMHMSCISFHQQGRQVATAKRADGKRITSIIAGSAYDFNLDYLGVQGNKHWRGVVMLHNISDGEFDEVYVPIDYLKRRYGGDMQPMMYTPEPEKK